MSSAQLQLLPPARPLVDRLGPEFFRALPPRPGVYYLSNAREGILYVGKSVNLRRRLASYRVAHPDRLPRKILRLLFVAERIDWDECPDEPAARSREKALLRSLQPRFNTADVRPAARPFIGWESRDDRLDLGLCRTAEEMVQSCGMPSGGALPVFTALTRLLSLAGGRPATLAGLPGRLLQWPPPHRVTIPLPSESACRPSLPRLLDDFLHGRSAHLGWLLAGVVDGLPAPPPRQAWLDDLETLHQFHRRRVRR